MMFTQRTPASKSACVIGIVSKAPQSGFSKTRLVLPLSPEEATQLSACFLRDTIANVKDVRSQREVDGVIVYTPVGTEPFFTDLLPENFRLLAQRGESIGERLLSAAEDLFSDGYQCICFIGSDSPTLPSQLILDALAALLPNGDRLVLGPSDDGGYYLIGLKQAHARVFSEIDWSTSKVLAQTLERASEIHLEVELLPAWYDVDDASSLSRLRHELFSSDNEIGNIEQAATGYLAVNTRRYLEQLMRGREF